MRKQKKEAGAAGQRVPPTTPDRVARFGQRDKNHDGVLSQEEFMSTLAGSDRGAGETRFKKLDTDRDGQLTQDEFLGTIGKTK
jgi:Ca2+-binding EF-hand superfamily protein